LDSPAVVSDPQSNETSCPIIAANLLTRYLRAAGANLLHLTRPRVTLDASIHQGKHVMLSFLRRRFDELATIAFLLLTLVLTILHPPVFATAGGLALAHWVLWVAGIVLAALLIVLGSIRAFARCSTSSCKRAQWSLQW
jgi:hypothetical protein